MSKQKSKAWAVAGLFFVAAIWGTGFIATQVAIDEGVGSAFIMVLRFTIAGAVMGAVSARELKKTTRKEVFSGLVAGVFLFGGFMLQTMGLEFSSTPSVNAFLTAANVILVPFIVWLVYKKRPAGRVFVSAVACLAGVGALSIQPGEAFRLAPGDLITLGGAFFFALHTVALAQLSGRINSRVLTFLQMEAAAALSAFVYFATVGFAPVQLTLRGFVAVLYLALASSCLAYFIQTHCQQAVSASKASLIIATESLFAALLSIMLGFEQFSIQIALGGVLILASLVLAEGEFGKKAKRSVKP